MKSIGNKISDTRKLKGLSQEELAAMAQISPRTVQRIENDENIPHGKTLQLICGVLGLAIEDLIRIEDKDANKGLGAKVLQGVFLVVLNVALMSVFGFLTLDSEASIHSRLGAVLLSFFLPLFIVMKTPERNGVQRFFQFGSGFVVYIIAVWIVHDFAIGVTTGLFICLGIALAVLFYGGSWVPNTPHEMAGKLGRKTY